jgi:C4-type Zn-finger protein
LAELETQLAQPGPLPRASIPTLEAVLAILDEELTAAFNQLYSL